MKKQQGLLLCNSNSSAIIYSPAAWLDIEKKPFAVIYTHGWVMRGGLVIGYICYVLYVTLSLSLFLALALLI